MFRLFTRTVRHRPGQSASQGACSMYLRPSRLRRLPQLGTSSGRPKPRKLKPASAMNTAPMSMLNTITTGAAIHPCQPLPPVPVLPVLGSGAPALSLADLRTRSRATAGGCRRRPPARVAGALPIPAPARWAAPGATAPTPLLQCATGGGRYPSRLASDRSRLRPRGRSADPFDPCGRSRVACVARCAPSNAKPNVRIAANSVTPTPSTAMVSPLMPSSLPHP